MPFNTCSFHKGKEHKEKTIKQVGIQGQVGRRGMDMGGRGGKRVEGRRSEKLHM